MSADKPRRTKQSKADIPAPDFEPSRESIIEEAELAAAKIRADAEAQADRYVSDYKRRIDDSVDEMSRATDTLIAQANTVKQQYERFLSSVDSAAGRETGDGSSPSSGSDPSFPPAPAPEPPPPPSPTPGGFRPRFASSDIPPAGTLVAQMADAGADREAVSKRLREEYGIEDPSTLLEQFDL